MSEYECPLTVQARERPDAPAIVTRNRIYSYADYDGEVWRVVANLRSMAVGDGDIVAVALQNSATYPILLMALFRAGAIAAPLNPKLPVQSMLDQLANLRCTEFIVPYGASVTADIAEIHAIAPRDLLSGAAPETGESVKFDAGQPATVVHTSGSSDAPKAALHLYGNHYASAEASNRKIPLEPGDRWLLSLPLFHVAGIGVIFRCLLAGAAVVVDDTLSPDEAVEKYGVTHLSLVSTQLHRILRAGQSAPLAKTKAILLGGGPMPPALVRRAVEAKLPIHTSYGLTEMATQAACTRPGADAEALNTSGYPIIENNLWIAEDGEIHVSGPTRFAGYIRNGELERPFDHEGRFATGDLGRFDDAGRLHVLGRKDNMFVSGGENIQPEEIERRLRELPGVEDACVVPTEDPEFGHVAVAFVKTAENAPLDPANVKSLLAQTLPPHKIPKAFYAWPKELEQEGMKVPRQTFIDLANR